ncbi:MAG: hypothetical protein ABIG32_00940, partial [Candidatus Uhrbacteria bacterium]
SVLVFVGILPPLSSYSIGNLLFSFARMATIIYAGILYFDKGLKKSALYGGILGFVMVAVFSLASFISKTYFRKPILGIVIPSDASYFLIMTIVILENVLLGVVIAVCASWITKKIKHK